jgi:hypothetical protein
MMISSGSYNPNIPVLHDWLAVATQGLASWERERIMVEITAHVEDGIAEGLEAGLSPLDARREAFASLGSPKKANWKNIRTCSNSFQEIGLQKFCRRYYRVKGMPPEISSLKWSIRDGSFLWRVDTYWAVLFLTYTLMSWFMFAQVSLAYIVPSIILPLYGCVEMWMRLFVIPRRLREGRVKLAYATSGLMTPIRLMVFLFPWAGMYSHFEMIVVYGMFILLMGVTLGHIRHFRNLPTDLTVQDVMRG